MGVSLAKSGWKSLSSWIGTKVSVGVSLFKSGWSSIKSFFGLKSGGYSTGKGFKLFAGGGSIAPSGAARFWRNIPAYAGGTSKAHGSLFLAGEAGPEAIGHINGRTEVLNKSQLAAAMYSAVVAGMSIVSNALVNVLGAAMVRSANGIISAIALTSERPVAVGVDTGLLNSLDRIADSVVFTRPSVASSLLPYSVQAAQNRDMAALLSDSNDELATQFARIMASTALGIVAAIRENKNISVNVDRDALADSMIDEINRRTVMYNRSPLRS